MELIQKIEPKVMEIVAAHQVNLYAIEFVNENGMQILRISLFSKERKIDLDLCSDISQAISEYLDNTDPIESDYYLEVCSSGAERELRNKEEIQQACNEHVYVKLKNPQNQLNEVYGDLVEVHDGDILVNYKVKTQNRQLKVEYENIQFIRLAVKL